jgi:hypothetical protein
MWQAGTSKAVASACVSYGPMGWPPQASIEHIDRILVFMGPISRVATVNRCLALPLLLHWLVWERNWVQTRGSVSQCAVDCVETHFSQEQWTALLC